MGQASPFKPIALVVEDDFWQREMAVTLLEESGMGVIQCESAEAAMSVLEKIGRAHCPDVHRREPGGPDERRGTRPLCEA